jgi:hypothetical protein
MKYHENEKDFYNSYSWKNGHLHHQYMMMMVVNKVMKVHHLQLFMLLLKIPFPRSFEFFIAFFHGKSLPPWISSIEIPKINHLQSRKDLTFLMNSSHVYEISFGFMDYNLQDFLHLA